jgi:uncharacterized protein (DUF1684 family)
MNAALLLVLLSTALSGDYVASVERFRRDRQERVGGQDGWASLAGLFFLKPGVNGFGGAKDNAIQLPGGAPAHAGRFVLASDTVRVEPEPGVALLGQGDVPVTAREMKADTTGIEDRVRLGALTFQVLSRGGRFAIRLWDNETPAHKGFHGLDWYPIRESYRVTGEFHSSPKTIPVTTILGYTEPMSSPGYVTFRLAGQDVRLEAVLEEPGADQLFFLFRDLTAGKATYGAGRFLYTPLPTNGSVVLDFNEAFAPPCAFTPFATCPIPPKENRVPIPIEAGEKGLGKH